MRTARTLVCSSWLLAIVTAATAQQSYIVDQSNGPGTDFRDMPIAVASVTHGDTLLVRPGSYTNFTVRVGITIIGGPNVFVNQGGPTYAEFMLLNLPGGRTFKMVDVDIFSVNPLGGGKTVDNCSGKVILERCNFTGSAPGLLINSSDDVLISGCSFANLRMINSRVAVSDSTSSGATSGPFGGAFGALYADRSDVTVSRCTLTGLFEAPPFISQGTGMELLNSTVRLTGDGSGMVMAGLGSLAISAIEGTNSTLTLDPDVVLLPANGAPPISGSVTVMTRDLPSLSTLGAAIGGVVQVDLFSTPGDAFLLVLGYPGAPMPFSNYHGFFWLDAWALVANGGLPASGRYTLSVPVPNASFFIGFPVIWQAFAGNVSNGFALSNPSGYIHTW